MAQIGTSIFDDMPSLSLMQPGLDSLGKTHRIDLLVPAWPMPAPGLASILLLERVLTGVFPKVAWAESTIAGPFPEGLEANSQGLSGPACNPLQLGRSRDVCATGLLPH